ncbi:MAG: hypothetical protein VR64_21455 [Desulfatitalea sp. BRH_c12]|nr:MAG: hypothetical protein VR64_21455 [Desulfatitalea sp. BRH_c12]
MLLIVSLAILLAIPAAWAQPNGDETTVVAVGSSRIRAKDMPAAREEAINAALVMAVSRALADLLPVETMVSNFQIINQSMFNQPDRYLRDYKVLTESQVGDIYRVMLQATVSVTPLKKSLATSGVTVQKITYPRVLLCVAQKRAYDLSPHYWWRGGADTDNDAATILSQALDQSGFILVRPGGEDSLSNYPPDLSAAEAVALGQRFDAEVVVVGLAEAEESGGSMSGSAYRGTLFARAFRVADGQLIAQVRHTLMAARIEPNSGGIEALRGVAASAGEELSARLAEVWTKEAASGTLLEVVVQGVSGRMAQFVKLRGALSGISGVDSLQMKEMMPGAAVLTVRYQGRARSLAEALEKHAFDTFSIRIIRVETGTIALELLPR